MDYLGLGPDEAYYDDEFDEEYEPRQRRGDVFAARAICRRGYRAVRQHR